MKKTICLLAAILMLVVCFCLPMSAETVLKDTHITSSGGDDEVTFESGTVEIEAGVTYSVWSRVNFNACNIYINGTLTSDGSSINVWYKGVCDTIVLGPDGLLDLIYRDNEKTCGIDFLVETLEKNGAEVTVEGNHIVARHKHDFDDAGKCKSCGKYNCQVGKAEHTFDDATGKCTRCGGSKCTLADHTWDENGKCRYCTALVCVEGKQSHRWETNGKCGVCGKNCENAFHHTPSECPDCHQPVGELYPSPAGSALSEGNLVIVAAVAGLAVGFLVAMFIFKKKKKPATENNAEE